MNETAGGEMAADRAGAHRGSEQGRPVMHSPPGPRTVVDGRPYLYFGGTAYLGLQGDPDLIQVASTAMQQYGLSSATSRSGLGNNPPTLDVERAAAEFFAAQDAFYFASGYLGTMVFVRGRGEQFDRLFVDEGSHYSILDALPLAGRPFHRFAHRDPQALAEALSQQLRAGERPLVLSDGVFSASGAIAPLEAYRQVLAGYRGAAVYVDDAHGVGVLGAAGRGSWEHAGIVADRVNAGRARGADDDAEVAAGGVRAFFAATLSKALGGFGGIVPGDATLIDRLKTDGHFYAGASPPPVPAAAATACALRKAIAEPGLRQRLRERAARLRAGLRTLGLAAEDSPVPFVGFAFGSAENMQRIERQLRQREILVPYLASYSGTAPQGVLRVAVTTDHTPQMIAQLIDALAEVL